MLSANERGGRRRPREPSPPPSVDDSSSEGEGAANSDVDESDGDESTTGNGWIPAKRLRKTPVVAAATLGLQPGQSRVVIPALQETDETVADRTDVTRANRVQRDDGKLWSAEDLRRQRDQHVYGKQWVDNQNMRQEILESHPDYKFLFAMAGHATRPIEQLVNQQSLRQRERLAAQRRAQETAHSDARRARETQLTTLTNHVAELDEKLKRLVEPVGLKDTMTRHAILYDGWKSWSKLAQLGEAGQLLSTYLTDIGNGMTFEQQLSISKRMIDLFRALVEAAFGPHAFEWLDSPHLPIADMLKLAGGGEEQGKKKKSKSAAQQQLLFFDTPLLQENEVDRARIVVVNSREPTTDIEKIREEVSQFVKNTLERIYGDTQPVTEVEALERAAVYVIFLVMKTRVLVKLRDMQGGSLEWPRESLKAWLEEGTGDMESFSEILCSPLPDASMDAALLATVNVRDRARLDLMQLCAVGGTWPSVHRLVFEPAVALLTEDLKRNDTVLVDLEKTLTKQDDPNNASSSPWLWPKTRSDTWSPTTFTDDLVSTRVDRWANRLETHTRVLMHEFFRVPELAEPGQPPRNPPLPAPLTRQELIEGLLEETSWNPNGGVQGVHAARVRDYKLEQQYATAPQRQQFFLARVATHSAKKLAALPQNQNRSFQELVGMEVKRLSRQVMQWPPAVIRHWSEWVKLYSIYRTAQALERDDVLLQLEEARAELQEAKADKEQGRVPASLEVDTPYEHERAWRERPENSGVLHLEPWVVSAIGAAWTKIQQYVPRLILKGRPSIPITAETLQRSPDVLDTFAHLCALQAPTASYVQGRTYQSRDVHKAALASERKVFQRLHRMVDQLELNHQTRLLELKPPWLRRQESLF